MFQLAPHKGLVETVGQPPKKFIYIENLLLIQYFFDWFLCPKYMWLDMPDAFCCWLSLFRVFAKIVWQPKHDFWSNLAEKVPQWVLIDLIS